MARDHRLPPFLLFFSLFGIPKNNPVLLSSHRRGSLAADCWCCTAPQRHGSVSSCVFECDSLIHPVKHSFLALSSVFSSSPAAPGGGWRANRACVGSSPISLITTQREETPALRFSLSSSFTSSLCKLALCLASPPSLPFCLHFPPLFPSPLPLLLQPKRARASK